MIIAESLSPAWISSCSTLVLFCRAWPRYSAQGLGSLCSLKLRAESGVLQQQERGRYCIRGAARDYNGKKAQIHANTLPWPARWPPSRHSGSCAASSVSALQNLAEHVPKPALLRLANSQRSLFGIRQPSPDRPSPAPADAVKE